MKPGIFTLAYKTIKRIPDIFRWVIELLIKFEGSLIIQLLVMCGIIFLLPPILDGIAWFWKNIFLALLDRTAK